MFSALLDTKVLWPGRQRDFLLTPAAFGQFQPLWSEPILEELHYTQVDKKARQGLEPDAAQVYAGHLIEQMRQHFSDAVVTGWERLEGTFSLRDPYDVHVLAAAVMGHAGVIVTGDADFERGLVPGRERFEDTLPGPIFLARPCAGLDSWQVSFGARVVRMSMTGDEGRRGSVLIH